MTVSLFNRVSFRAIAVTSKSLQHIWIICIFANNTISLRDLHRGNDEPISISTNNSLWPTHGSSSCKKRCLTRCLLITFWCQDLPLNIIATIGITVEFTVSVLHSHELTVPPCCMWSEHPPWSIGEAQPEQASLPVATRIQSYRYLTLTLPSRSLREVQGFLRNRPLHS